MSALAEKLFERSLLLLKAKDFDGTARLLQDVLKLDWKMSEAWILRGNVRAAQGEHLDALLHYERALTIDGDLYDAWNNLGTALSNMGCWEMAADAFKKALMAKDYWEPHCGLGTMFCSTMDLKRAEEHFTKAAERDNTAERRFQLGCVQLGQGKWSEGYPNYSCRWHDTPQPPLARRALRQWNGEDLKGKTIVLYPDQGAGDEIMAMRFVNWLQDADCIVLQTRLPLQEIAAWSLPCKVIPLHGPVPKADFGCSTLDLPIPLELDWTDVSHPPYLRADPWRSKRWQERLPKGFNVGVCWMSGGHFSTTLSIQRMKSIPAVSLRALKQPGVNLISLQKPIMERLPPDLELIDYMDEVDDFADTAALMDNLDLIISVDTAVAHLAGALGKKVWNLVRFSGYWPWLAPDVAGPSKSIWYPSMTLYRQPRLGDWEQPLSVIARDLEVTLANPARKN